MTEKTLSGVLDQYIQVLQKRKELAESYQQQNEKLLAIKAKMEAWLLSQNEEIPFESKFSEDEPYVFWKVTPKTVESAIIAYRTVRDMVSTTNGKAKDVEAEQNANKDKIGAWLLAEANKMGVDNFSKKGIGKAYKKLKTHANIVDWDAFLVWAAENQAADAIQKRVNSAFVNKYFEMKLEEDKEVAEAEGREPNGEYPPFLDIRKEYEIVVTK